MIFNQTYVSPPYSPLIWNDTGKYDYFYIDFKKPLTPFSTGMFIESVLVYGTAPITITALEKINATTYKVYANISGLIHGFVVMSKSPTRLKLITGKELPTFSSFTFVSGVSSYIDGGYYYEKTNYTGFVYITSYATPDISLCPNDEETIPSESVSFTLSLCSSVQETPTIVLT